MELDRRSLAVIAAVAAVAVLLALRWVGSGGGDAETIALTPPPDGAPAAAERAGPDRAGTAAPTRSGANPGAPDGPWVHVAGAVRDPGLYRLPRGARVAQAVELAGGPARRADLAGVNLAAEVVDGQQVVVPVRGRGVAPSAAAPAAQAGGAPATPATPISLSTATVEQLETLDGIGPTLARRIVQYRDAHGGFRSIGELREVEGIGEKRFEALRRAVRP